MDLAGTYIFGTFSNEAEPISPDEKVMLWSSQQFGTHVETITFNSLILLLLIINYYYNYDDIQIQFACIMIV